MKKIKIVGLFFLAAVLSLRVSAQDNNKEQLTVPLSDASKPYRLNVGLVDGSISISVYDGKDIMIDAEGDGKKTKSESSDNSGGMRKLSSHGLSVIAEEKNNRVSVHSEKPNTTIHLYIKVPKGAESIKLETVNNGDIVVNGVNGEMEITNVNGSIQLSGVSGSVVANTVNGDVVASFKSVDTQAPMAFSTLNGNVDVSFPATIKAAVKLKSDNGGIYTDFEIAVDRKQPVNERSSEGTMYKISVSDWVYGKIAGGGPEILMKNMNGNIYIRKAK